MEAAQRFVKRVTNTPRYKPAPHWNVDGDGPPWDTTKQSRIIYNLETREFEEFKS